MSTDNILKSTKNCCFFSILLDPEIDASSIIEEKEYYSSLPKSIIKDFDMFMLQYKVPEEKAAEFANLLGSADWSKEE